MHWSVDDALCRPCKNNYTTLAFWSLSRFLMALYWIAFSWTSDRRSVLHQRWSVYLEALCGRKSCDIFIHVLILLLAPWTASWRLSLLQRLELKRTGAVSEDLLLWSLSPRSAGLSRPIHVVQSGVQFCPRRLFRVFPSPSTPDPAHLITRPSPFTGTH